MWQYSCLSTLELNNTTRYWNAVISQVHNTNNVISWTRIEGLGNSKMTVQLLMNKYYIHNEYYIHISLNNQHVKKYMFIIIYFNVQQHLSLSLMLPQKQPYLKKFFTFPHHQRSNVFPTMSTFAINISWISL